MTSDDDALDAARLRCPLGSTVSGRIRPQLPGVSGLFVDLGQPPEGFVDVLNLPWSGEDWPPAVGHAGHFRVRRHLEAIRTLLLEAADD